MKQGLDWDGDRGDTCCITGLSVTICKICVLLMGESAAFARWYAWRIQGMKCQVKVHGLCWGIECICIGVLQKQ
jgi:hypothetical protein